MIEPRDEELFGIYREAEARGPSQRVDDNILAASQRVAGATRRPAGGGFARRWGTPAALAATVLVTSTLTLMVFERESGLDTTVPAATRAARPAKAVPPGPKRAELAPAESPRVVPAEKSSPPEAQSAGSVDTPLPRPSVRRDQQRTLETALSNKAVGTGQPAAQSSRASDALRKREEAKPFPAPPAASSYSGGRAVTDQPVPALQDLPAAAAPRQQVPLAPAAAPVAGAGGLRESAPALSGAGVASGIANSPAGPEKERTPEKWLTDIRVLKIEGKAAEAERELAEFRKRYPDYRLPDDLR